MNQDVNQPTGLDPHRLPDEVVPRHYRIRIEPDLDAERFSGRVEIDVEVVRATDRIVFNNDGLELHDVTVDGRPVEFRVDAEAQRVELDAEMAVGEAVIGCSFAGAFDENLVGFYLSRFTHDGEERRIATTQFEATHARKAFPCWDEPIWKATFDLELVIDPAHEAIANAAETGRETLDDGRTLVRFATTMKMSTYLVAFVVGPIEWTEPVDVDGVPLRVVHVAGKDSSLTEFAVEAATFALRYFTEYFDIAYPGDKVDLVAIPDFAFGAMENLGCITFRETLLLIDPDAATQTELQLCADVINHELAHMWFGDLVTMSWWNGLWLNEAFATFMEMRCTDAFRPAWERWVDFGLSRTAAFDTDGMAATRPIEFEVTSPEEAEGMFDILTYEKGAAVVRMLEQFLGEDRFRAGIRRYMRANAYGNAETTDLWDAIEAEVADGPDSVPVRELMDSWIFQGGFPLVSVELAANGRSVTMSQERFGYVGGDPADEQTWMIPLRYRWKPCDGDPVTGQVLLTETDTEIDLPAEAEWLVANAEGASFVRIAYPPDALDALAAIALEQLTSVERYALVDDAWAAVLADRMTAATFLDLLESLTAEHDRSVWVRMIAGFRALDHLLDDDARVRYAEIVHDALAPALAGLTLSPQVDEPERARQLRGDLIRAMGTIANDHEIQEEAQRTVAEGRRDPELVDASVMAAAVDVAASIGDAADLADYLDGFRTSENPQEQLRWLYATADFPDEAHAAQVRPMTLDGGIRTQNVAFWIRRSLANRHTGRATWDFVQERWDDLVAALPSSAITRMIESLAGFDRPGDTEAIGAFFANHPIEQGRATLAQILERQRVNAALRAREADRLRAVVAG